MTRRRRITIAVVASLGAVLALALGVRHVVRHTFLSPIDDATTDLAAYPTVLGEWRSSGLVKHFPDAVPSSAQAVRFSAFPGSGQGHAWIQLRLTLPRDLVATIAASARATAGQVHEPDGRILDAANGRPATIWPTPGFHVGDDPKTWDFPGTFTVYMFGAVDHGSGSWDPHDAYGVAVSESTGEVVYWARR